jgi:hypothetical protein
MAGSGGGIRLVEWRLVEPLPFAEPAPETPMSHRAPIAIRLLAALLAAPALAAAADQASRYDAARDQYEIGHFDIAFSTFAELADGGHCEALRMATQMLRQGRALYAIDFKLEPVRLAAWQAHTHCATPPRKLAATR